MSLPRWPSRILTGEIRRGRVRSGRQLSGLVAGGRLGVRLVLGRGMRRGRHRQVEEGVTREGGMITGSVWFVSIYVLDVIVF